MFPNVGGVFLRWMKNKLLTMSEKHLRIGRLAFEKEEELLCKTLRVKRLINALLQQLLPPACCLLWGDC